MDVVLRWVIIGIVALAAWPRHSAAQDYPTHSVTILVPFAPGGGDGVGALDLDRFELRILNDEVLAAGHHVIHFARVDFRNDTRVFGMRRRS